MTSPRAKHVRRAVVTLRRLGTTDIVIEPGRRIGVRWTFAGVAMRIATAAFARECLRAGVARGPVRVPAPRPGGAGVIRRLLLELLRRAFAWPSGPAPRVAARQLVAPPRAGVAAGSASAARRAWGEIRARYRLKDLTVPA